MSKKEKDDKPAKTRATKEDDSGTHPSPTSDDAAVTATTDVPKAFGTADTDRSQERSTFPDVDTAGPEPAPAAKWRDPQHLLDELYTHAKATHGLAGDKQLMLDVVDYLSHHLADQGFDVVNPRERFDE